MTKTPHPHPILSYPMRQYSRFSGILNLYLQFVIICSLCYRLEKENRLNNRFSFYLFHIPAFVSVIYFFKKSGISMLVKLGETSGIEDLLIWDCPIEEEEEELLLNVPAKKSDALNCFTSVFGSGC